MKFLIDFFFLLLLFNLSGVLVIKFILPYIKEQEQIKHKDRLSLQNYYNSLNKKYD